MRFFGAARVEIDGVPVAMHSRRSMALLAFVTLNQVEHTRATLAATFWEDAAPEVARANLRSVLSTLQSRLPGVLEVTRSTVAFGSTNHVDVDVQQFLAAVSAAESAATSADRIDACRLALDRHRGELLSGFEHLGVTALTGWLESERRVLERRAVGAAAFLVELLLADMRHAEAVQAADRLVTLDRYREASYLASMRALLADGEPQKALDEFERCRSLVVDDLGLTLGHDITSLERAIRDDAPMVEEPTRPVLSRMGGLPVRRALFGRDTLVEEIATAQRDTAGGLLTLWGPAGVGKTSLAVEVAHRWREQGRDVVFVDATNAHDAPQLIETLSNAIGGPLVPTDGSDGLADVAEVLADREVSVVVDNVEQIDGAASVLGALLGRCPGLFLMATSRRPMRIAAETVREVPALEPPTVEQVSQDARDDAMALGTLKRLACVQLFQHRCVVGGSRPASSSDELRAVGRICRLVDGLPLAIELLAGRRQILGLTDIEASLRSGLRDGDLSVVDGGFSDAPQRHRGLSAALTSSVALLDPSAQRVFAILSVFDGPFTFDGVAAVCVDDDHDLRSVLHAVQALADFHLLRRDELHGIVWFRMLSAVRALATSLLDRHDADRALARRIAHDCDLVERSADEYFSPANTEWFHLLDEYTPTLRSTLDELHERSDPRELAVVTSLAPYWFDRGRVAEAHHRLAAAESSATDDERPWLPALCALWSAGMRAEAVGYGTAADTLAEVNAALADLREAGPPPLVVLRALRLVVHVHVIDHSAPLDAASALVDEGIHLADAADRPWFRADFLYNRAVIDHLRGDDERAAGRFLVALDEAEQHGNRRVCLYARMMLDMVDAPGDGAGTTENLSELLDLAIEIGDHRQTIWLTMSLGSIAAHLGDLRTAAAQYLDALSLSRDADYFIGVGCCLMAGAGIAVMRGDTIEAVRFHACVEPDLESLGRSMPQSNLEVYRQLTDSLAADAEADPVLADAWSYGSTSPRSTMLTRLAAYLSLVRREQSSAIEAAS
jgi:predicted ATPase/DNA-binding SARP family transcriptional activator